ncbi:MAG: MFS transporter, partial [Proteobacteria bacterium]|nr:MFS transporter [Pseudomonadota bacterium]
MSQIKLLKQKTFFPLFLTQFCGAFNDNFLKNAFVILVTFHGLKVAGLPEGVMVAVIGGCFILPFFLFSAQAGILADRWDKTRVIRYVKVAEVGIMGVAGAGLLTQSTLLLLSSVFLMGIHSTVFGPVKFSILPQHLNEDEIVGGNALIEAGTFLAVLLGTIMGGVMIELTDGALWVTLGLILVSVLGLISSFQIPSAPPSGSGIPMTWNPVSPTWEILKSTRKVPSVFNSLMGLSWFWFLGAAFLTLFPTYAKETLHQEQGVVTLFLCIFSIGIAVGSLLCERLSRHHLELGLVPFGSIGMSVFCA